MALTRNPRQEEFLHLINFDDIDKDFHVFHNSISSAQNNPFARQ
jgi:hypothetical protein